MYRRKMSGESFCNYIPVRCLEKNTIVYLRIDSFLQLVCRSLFLDISKRSLLLLESRVKVSLSVCAFSGEKLCAA